MGVYCRVTSTLKSKLPYTTCLYYYKIFYLSKPIFCASQGQLEAGDRGAGAAIRNFACILFRTEIIDFRIFISNAALLADWRSAFSAL